MPLITFEIPVEHGKIFLWHVTESSEELLSILQRNGRHDLHPSPPFVNRERNMEWLAVRCALIEAFQNNGINISYNENGRPFPVNINGHFSISHAWPYVCIFYNEHKSVGVDVEMMNKRILRIASRFLNIVSHDRPDWNPSRQIFSNNLVSSVTGLPHSWS